MSRNLLIGQGISMLAIPVYSGYLDFAVLRDLFKHVGSLN